MARPDRPFDRRGQSRRGPISRKHQIGIGRSGAQGLESHEVASYRGRHTLKRNPFSCQYLSGSVGNRTNLLHWRLHLHKIPASPVLVLFSSGPTDLSHIAVARCRRIIDELYSLENSAQAAAAVSSRHHDLRAGCGGKSLAIESSDH